MFILLRKCIIVLVALSLLNQSVDLDNLTISCFRHGMSSYDDIDSITEYIVELVMKDDNYIPEDKHGRAPQNKGAEKHSHIRPYYVEEKTESAYNTAAAEKKESLISYETFKTCKGFFNIVSPPPDHKQLFTA